jgi:hypothetical protein
MELLRRWVVARLRRRIRELFRHLYLRQVEHLQPWQQQRATKRFEAPDGALGPLVQHCSRRLQELYQRQQLELYTAPPSGAYQRYRL